MQEQQKNRIRVNHATARARRYPKSILNRLAPCLFFGFLVLALPAMAQLPGMEPASRTESRVSIGGEEKSGRGILIPNAILFQNTIINYTLDQEYMLDEVPVRLTFDSDWERAKEIMIAAAGEVTKDIIAKTGEAPFIRAEFLDWGVLVRLRYKTIPAQRQEISTYIIEILLREFGKEFPRVRFAIPSQTIRYRPDAGDGGTSREPSRTS